MSWECQPESSTAVTMFVRTPVMACSFTHRVDRLLAPLVVVPTLKSTSREPSRVGGKVGLDPFERQCGQFDQLAQGISHFGRPEVAQNGVEVGVTIGQAIGFGLTDLTVETPSGQTESTGETQAKAMSDIGSRGRPRPCAGVGRVAHRSASMAGNRSPSSHWPRCARAPILAVGDPNGLGQHIALGGLPPDDNLDGDDVFAWRPAKLEAGRETTKPDEAGTLGDNSVIAVPRLGRTTHPAFPRRSLVVAAICVPHCSRAAI